MPLHVIVGAGPVGSATADLLAARGEQVRLVTRRGGGPQHPRIERVSADATDADRLAELARGADALYNCASPPYHRWLSDWPPLAAAMLAAAERSGAVLASAGNLYGYGPTAGPITATTPLAATHPKLRLRAQMWLDAQTAHAEGRIRATEVRASDYLEANSIFTIALAAPLLAGKRATVPAKLDEPHSWTSIADVAATLVVVAGDERAWGKPWLVPTNPALTMRQLATRFTEIADAPEPRLTAVPYPVLWAAGLFSSELRELRATHYQWDRPFTVDSSVTETTFGLTPSSIDTALRTVQTTTTASD